MFRGYKIELSTFWATVFWVCMCFMSGANVFGGEIPPIPQMPAHWKIVYDFSVPAEQVKAMSSKIGADLSGVRNTIYDVNGKRVQINVIIAPDSGSAEKLMTKLKSIKVEESLLRKELIIYEFVGQNDVLPLIAEGRKYLDAK